MIEVRVPDEQEGTKAVVRSWLRRVGDLVFENEPLVELAVKPRDASRPRHSASMFPEFSEVRGGRIAHLRRPFGS